MSFAVTVNDVGRSQMHAPVLLRERIEGDGPRVPVPYNSVSIHAFAIVLLISANELIHALTFGHANSFQSAKAIRVGEADNLAAGWSILCLKVFPSTFIDL